MIQATELRRNFKNCIVEVDEYTITVVIPNEYNKEEKEKEIHQFVLQQYRDKYQVAVLHENEVKGEYAVARVIMYRISQAQLNFKQLYVRQNVVDITSFPTSTFQEEALVFKDEVSAILKQVLPHRQEPVTMEVKDDAKQILFRFAIDGTVSGKDVQSLT